MKERGHIEQLWREEKYHVLLHSQQSYQMIRNALKTDLSLHQVQQMIDVNSGLKMLFYGGLKMSFFSGLRLSYI
ncbi:type II DNA modification enzyme [Staphylococcus aureus]|nr:type II DNA modification enzyme [Staphylococcus aureus]